MGIHFFKWLHEKMSAGSYKIGSQEIPCSEFYDLTSDIYARELAFWSCTNLIANAVCKCEFKTYSQNTEIKQQEWYLWNIEPNKNQSSSEFLHQLIGQLYRNNEALVIETDGQLLIADDFSHTQYALYDDVFTDVSTRGFDFSHSFVQSEVLYFHLSNQNMRQLINGVYESYSKLITYGMKSYCKSRGQKGIITVDALQLSDQNFQKEYARLKNGQFREFFESENGVMPLYKGFGYTDLGNKTYSNEGTRDIRALIDDVSVFTARAFGIPPALISGEVQGVSDALEQFLTFCIDPLTDMLSEEINRKRYGYTEFSKGRHLQIDTKSIKHVDLLSVSASIDKLIASGAFCVNDILKLVGEQPIDAAWASQHFMTKNYAAVDDLLNPLGGENI